MDILSKLPDRLQELMLQRDMNASDLAKQLGVEVSTVSRYMKGERLPSFSYFVNLLETFDCSADFLIGLVEYPPSGAKFLSVPPFNERFRWLLDKYKMSQYALHKKTNLSYDNFNKWLKGKSRPFLDNLLKLSQAFECSVDYLIGRVN